MTEAEALDLAAKAAGWPNGWGWAADEWGGLIIRAHAKTLMENAALKAEVERLREEITLLKSLPDDIAETVLKLGPVEWGQTDPKDAGGHGESVKNSVELTAAHFHQEGLQPMNGLYLVGEDTVVCHTGTSPNSAQVARALTGAWNLMHDHARTALERIDRD